MLRPWNDILPADDGCICVMHIPRSGFTAPCPVHDKLESIRAEQERAGDYLCWTAHHEAAMIARMAAVALRGRTTYAEVEEAFRARLSPLFRAYGLHFMVRCDALAHDATERAETAGVTVTVGSEFGHFDPVSIHQVCHVRWARV